MKNSLIKTVIFVILSLSIVYAKAQKKGKSFEGIITFAISIEGQDLSESEKAAFPSQSTVMLKNGKEKTEIKTMFANQISISDRDKQVVYMLINMETAGFKKYLTMKKEDIDKSAESLPTYELKEINETKEIAGFNCKKAELVDEEGNVNTVYYTEDMNIDNPNWNNPQFRNIKGVPLEYTMNVANFTMKYAAKEIKKKKIKDSEFEIPADYKEMTQEEAQQMMGGGF